MVETSSACILLASVAVHSDVIAEVGFASAAEGFDCENVAFFHALIGFGLDEGDLFVTMDLIT